MEIYNVEEFFKMIEDELRSVFNYGSDSPRIGYDRKNKVIRYCTSNYDWYTMPLNLSDATDSDILRAAIRMLLGVEYIKAMEEDGEDDWADTFKYMFGIEEE